VSIFIGGPLDGFAAGHISGPTHEHKRQLGRGEIHRGGVKVHRLDPTEYTASVTDFYRRVEIEGAMHYAHNSLSLEQAKRMMEL
jgi:hypothetical protein